MQVSELEHFRDLLLDRSQNLTNWLNSSSRIQINDVEKVKVLMEQIKEALDRINDISFGQCTICHDKVELHKLEVQPTTQICLDCISEKEKAVLQEDLYLASKVYRALLPQSIPEIDKFELAVFSQAARIIGGDYYDFLDSPENNIPRLVIADTMGKGLPAGLLMSNFQGALRILSSEISSLSTLFTRLNQWLCRNIPVTKFVSLVCLSLERIENGETKVTYVNAGHCPPLLKRIDGSYEFLDVSGGVLGVHEQFTYQELTVTLYPGDYLLLYTDGITEAMDEKDELYDEKRLIEFVSNNQNRTVDKIIKDLINEVKEYSSSSNLDDDITVMVIRMK